MNYAESLVHLGRVVPARQAYEQSIPGRRRDLGADHPRTRKAVSALAALPR